MCGQVTEINSSQSPSTIKNVKRLLNIRGIEAIDQDIIITQHNVRCICEAEETAAILVH